jgi:signal transduction histidine kinase
MLIIKKTQSPIEIDSVALVHELRNPLNNISLSCEQIKDELKDLHIEDENLGVYIDIIKRNCCRLNNLVADLFNSDTQNEDSESQSVICILEESLSIAEDRIKLKKIKLEKDFHSGDSAYFTNPNRLKMAFLNIIINAVESMTAGNGVLKIKTYFENNLFWVQFSDNGTGIKEEEIPQLFEPFYSNKKGGLGMGLAITKEVLKKASANIEVKSIYGKGSTFTISFIPFME